MGNQGSILSPSLPTSLNAASIGQSYYDNFALPQPFDSNVVWKQIDIEDEFMKTPEYNDEVSGKKKHKLKEKKKAILKAKEKRYVERKVNEVYGCKSKFIANTDYILIIINTNNTHMMSNPDYLLVPGIEFTNVHSGLLNILRNQSITKVKNGVVRQYLNINYVYDTIMSMYNTNASSELVTFIDSINWFVNGYYGKMTADYTDNKIINLRGQDQLWYTKSVNGRTLNENKIYSGNIDDYIKDINDQVKKKHCQLAEVFMVDATYSVP